MPDFAFELISKAVILFIFNGGTSKCPKMAIFSPNRAMLMAFSVMSLFFKKACTFFMGALGHERDMVGAHFEALYERIVKATSDLATTVENK